MLLAFRIALFLLFVLMIEGLVGWLWIDRERKEGAALITLID